MAPHPVDGVLGGDERAAAELAGAALVAGVGPGDRQRRQIELYDGRLQYVRECFQIRSFVVFDVKTVLGYLEKRSGAPIVGTVFLNDCTGIDDHAVADL